MERFEAVYSVSDLHLGGQRDDAKNFQIFDARQAPVLAGAIDELAQHLPGRRVALVLNGDVIDTLAEEGGRFIRVDDAVETFERIGADPSFEEVFDALGRFVAQPGRVLVVAIGNHDLELAFPDVQEAWLRRLGIADRSANGADRVRFTPPGQPMTFDVGGHAVYVTHGNEVDAWNVVDIDDLVAVIDRKLRNLPFDSASWKPNAGTRLVVTVMNDLKRRHPFADLLKPETGLAVPVLAALDRRAFLKIGSGAKAAAQAATTGTRRLGLDLLDESRATRPADDLLAAAVGKAMRVDDRTGEDFLRESEDRRERGETADADGGRLDLTIGSVFDALFGDLREAMTTWARGDESFVYDRADEFDKLLIDRIGPRISVLVAGHTHLPRSLQAQARPLVYLNTGTWARVIEVRAGELADPELGADIVERLRSGRMADLDAPTIPVPGGGHRPLARTQGLVAAVEVEAGRVRARLWSPSRGRLGSASPGGVERVHDLGPVQ
jgi:UDP-2,3-diacylglucosamine pyrophosphatase LpxH